MCSPDTLFNSFPFEWVLRALIDFTLSNARRFYSSMGNLLDGKGLNTFRTVWTPRRNVWLGWELVRILKKDKLCLRMKKTSYGSSGFKEIHHLEFCWTQWFSWLARIFRIEMEKRTQTWNSASSLWGQQMTRSLKNWFMYLLARKITKVHGLNNWVIIIVTKEGGRRKIVRPRLYGLRCPRQPYPELPWASCLASAGRQIRAGETTFSHVNSSVRVLASRHTQPTKFTSAVTNYSSTIYRLRGAVASMESTDGMEEMEALCKKLSFLSSRNQLKWHGSKKELLRF